jgi:ribosomal protein L40E
MGETSDGLRDETEGQGRELEEVPRTICSNCKTENEWDARLCRVCFAPLEAGQAKICPHCLTPNEESAHLCRKCLTPLSAHSTIDPVLGITARFDTIGKAATAPRKPIVLIGMWLLFGPTTLFLGMGVLCTEGIWRLVLAAIAVVPTLLLIKTTANFIKGPPATEREGFPVMEEKSEKVEVEDGGDEREAGEEDSLRMGKAVDREGGD